MEQRLIIDFVDERYEVAPTESLTFGRDGDLVVDELNPYMHRIVGSFVRHHLGWWVRNEGTRSELSVACADGRQVQVPPGSAEPLLGDAGTVRFRSGPANYALVFTVGDAIEPPPSPSAAVSRPDTQPFGVLRLNDEQRLLATALAEAWLRDRPPADRLVPANADTAQRLGWSLKKLDRKLDYLCTRLTQLGVPGLHGSVGGEANDRRLRLVEHILAAAMIDATDLAALERHEQAVADAALSRQQP